MPELLQVKFLEDQIVQDENRKDPVHRKVMRGGQVYAMTEASYRHWLARAPIELVDAPPLAPPPSLHPPAHVSNVTHPEHAPSLGVSLPPPGDTSSVAPETQKEQAPADAQKESAGQPKTEKPQPDRGRRG